MEKMTMKALRINAGLTQRDVAKAIGTTTGTLCRWERGYTVPPFDKMAQLAELYKCSTEDFSLPNMHV